MSPEREWRFRVHDILEAIQNIEEYMAGQSFEEFVADRKTVDAVIRNFIVIGEAAARMPQDVVERSSFIPWPEMKALRNFVVHEYFGVSDKILWDTAKNDLTPLPASLRDLLA